MVWIFQFTKRAVVKPLEPTITFAKTPIRHMHAGFLFYDVLLSQVIGALSIENKQNL